MEKSSPSSSHFDFDHSVHVSIDDSSNCTCLDSDIRGRLKWPFYRCSTTLKTWHGVKRGGSRAFWQWLSLHAVLPQASPTSPKTRLRCLPLKSRMGSNRTSAFNRAAVFSQGPLMELQDWDLGQIVWEEWDLGTFRVRCRAAGLLMDAAEGPGLHQWSTLKATSGAYWLITDFTVESHPRNALRKQIKREITMLAKAIPTA